MAAIVRLLRPTEYGLKKRYVLLILLLLAGALLFWAYSKKNELASAPFAKVKRETLVSTLPTNGKVEPIRYASVRVDVAGLIAQLSVKEGQRVSQGAELAHLSVPGLDAQLAAAQSRVEQAKAEHPGRAR